MTKSLSVVFAVILLLGSFIMPAHAENTAEHKSLYWPENHYDFSHKAPNPSPWLGELEVGDNSVSSLLKGHYTFTAPETGYYELGEWCEESLKIEGDKVTEINDISGAGPFSVITYLVKGVEHCFRFFNNSGVEDNSDMSEPGEITIRYLGKLSVKPEENACVYMSDLLYSPNERMELFYSVSNIKISYTFSEGLTIVDIGCSGKLDSTEPGKRKLTVPEFLEGPGFDIEFTLLGYNDYIEEIKLGEGAIQEPGDFYSNLTISYCDLEDRKEHGDIFELATVNTPKTIDLKLKDGTIKQLEPKYCYYYGSYADRFGRYGITGCIRGSARFTLDDGSEHIVEIDYIPDEGDRIVFHVYIDNELVFKEYPICFTALLLDFWTFCSNITNAFKESGSIADSFESLKTEVQFFTIYCKYIFSNGYFSNIGFFKGVLKEIGK